jgi:hypothetical protein
MWLYRISRMERTVLVKGTLARLEVSMVDCALLGAHIAAQTSAANVCHAAYRARSTCCFQSVRADHRGAR